MQTMSLVMVTPAMVEEPLPASQNCWDAHPRTAYWLVLESFVEVMEYRAHLFSEPVHFISAFVSQ